MLTIKNNIYDTLISKSGNVLHFETLFNIRLSLSYLASALDLVGSGDQIDTKKLCCPILKTKRRKLTPQSFHSRI